MDHYHSEQEVVRNEETHTESESIDEQRNVVKEQFAGFWIRFWAYIIDLVIVFSINGTLLSPLMFIESSPVYIAGIFTLQGILSTLTSYLYFLFMTKAFEQTLGKMIVGVKVVRTDRGPLTWNDLLFREVVGRFIHRSLVITNVLYVIVGVTQNKQGIHDMFGNTEVIHVEK